jgi:hypothetical protein
MCAPHTWAFVSGVSLHETGRAHECAHVRASACVRVCEVGAAKGEGSLTATSQRRMMQKMRFFRIPENTFSSLFSLRALISLNICTRRR